MDGSKPIKPLREITSDDLLFAYANGIFPMGESRENQELIWVKPEFRGILPLDAPHISKSLLKFMKTAPYWIRFDHSFEPLVRLCQEDAPDREDTWITDSLIGYYIELHQRGFAHSVEIWQENQLVGGLFGVAIGGAFFGESMVSRATNASKIALLHLMARLWEKNYRLLDTQFLTPHLISLGGIEIPSAEYNSRLKEAIKLDTTFSHEMDKIDSDNAQDIYWQSLLDYCAFMKAKKQIT